MFDHIPEDDDDILGGDSSHSGAVYSPDGKGFPIPDSVLRELAASLADHLSQNSLPREFRAMCGMFEYFADIVLFDISGPMLAAVAQVLDQETDGRVRALYELREAERVLSSTHQVLRVQDGVMSKLRYENLDMSSHIYQTKFFTQSFVNLTNHVQAKAINKYRLMCERLNKEPDEVLITTGYYSKRDIYSRIAMLRPPANGDT